jgi:hypothetical protein
LADYAGMGIGGIFVIDPATDTYSTYQQGSLDFIGGPCTVGHCQIDFDEIKVLRAYSARKVREANSNYRAIRGSTMLEAASFER